MYSSKHLNKTFKSSMKTQNLISNAYLYLYFTLDVEVVKFLRLTEF